MVFGLVKLTLIAKSTHEDGDKSIALPDFTACCCDPEAIRSAGCYGGPPVLLLLLLLSTSVGFLFFAALRIAASSSSLPNSCQCTNSYNTQAQLTQLSSFAVLSGWVAARTRMKFPESGLREGGFRKQV